jgi:hypothetical protein
MLETISLDSKTIILKANKENDLWEVLDYIAKKSKRSQVDAFLKFAATHKVLDAGYKFNRNSCYDR